MPYPADVDAPPRRVFQDLPAFAGTPQVSWMPDNRHVVLSASPGGSPSQLYLADTASGAFSVLSSGAAAQVGGTVSPDGTRLVFRESTDDLDVVSVDLATAEVTRLIATQRSEQMPAWAAADAALVYVTDRNGQPEIWLHKPGQPDRPVVTARDFLPGKTQWFMSPSLSPDATRVIYAHFEGNGPGQLWISAVAGGAPVRLVRSSSGLDHAGSWSPDGNWFVYWDIQEGVWSLNKVKTTGQAEPEVLVVEVERGAAWVPRWSPSGEWILHGDDGVKLLSPDGMTTREITSTNAVACTFSADGQTIYGLRNSGADRPGLELFSVSVSGGPEKTLGSLAEEYRPVAELMPSLRLSLTPDGRRITYSTRKQTNNLWLMEGLDTVAPVD